MMMFFSDADDEVLVEQVRNHPELYNLRHELYKDQRTKDQTWVHIADIVGKPVHQCKKRWRNIKDTYDRKTRRRLDPTFDPASSPTRKRRRWALDSKLSFLSSPEVHRRGNHFLSSLIPPQEGAVDSHLLGDDQTSTASQYSNETTTQYSTEIPTQYSTEIPTQYSTEIPTSISLATPSGSLPHYPTTTLREIKREYSDSDNEDDIDLFFRSLAKSVKKLPPPLQRRAKLDTLRAVSELESEEWTEQQHCSNVSNNHHVLNTSSGAESDEGG